MIEIKDCFPWGGSSRQNILYLGAWDVVVGNTFYGGVLNSMIKLKLKTSQKLKVFLFSLNRQLKYMVQK